MTHIKKGPLDPLLPVRAAISNDGIQVNVYRWGNERLLREISKATANGWLSGPVRQTTALHWWHATDAGRDAVREWHKQRQSK